MFFAGVFTAIGVVMIGLLFLCWRRYWGCIRRRREVEAVLHGRDLWMPGERQPLYAQLEKYDDGEDAWFTRYHWCLFLVPICLSIATFCAVLHWTGEWVLWMNIPLSAFSGVLMLCVGWWLGYGLLRECVLPLEDCTLGKKE